MAKTKKRKKSNLSNKQKAIPQYFPLSVSIKNYLLSYNPFLERKNSSLLARKRMGEKNTRYTFKILMNCADGEYDNSLILKVIDKMNEILSEHYFTEKTSDYVKRSREVAELETLSNEILNLPLSDMEELYKKLFESFFDEKYVKSIKPVESGKLDVYNFFSVIAVIFAAATSIQSMVPLLNEQKESYSSKKREAIVHTYNALVSTMENAFVLNGYKEKQNWVFLEENLRRQSDPEKLFFTEELVSILSNKNPKNGITLKIIIYLATAMSLYDWMHESFISNKMIDSDSNFNELEYINNRLLKNDDEMAKFIIRCYNSFEKMVFGGAERNMVCKYFDLKESYDKTLKKECKTQKETVKKQQKEIDSLMFQVENLKKEFLSEQGKRKEVENSIQASVKNATKEQADENASLRKKLKEYSEDNKKLSNKIAELETQTANVKEDEISESKSVSFDLSAYLKVRDKRIVFVRSKYSETFPIFTEIEKAFPNAKFVDAISDDFNGKATDCVVLMTRCMKHYTYWDMKNSSKANNIPFIHCNHQNLGVIANLISEELLK